MSPTVVLDTDVFSFFFKRDSRRAPYEPAIANTQVCLSFQSVAELRLWSLVRRWGDARRQSLEQAMARCIILPYDDRMSHAWATVTAERRRLGRPIETGDAWIAATALRHDATLLTHNARDYADIPNLHVFSHVG
jgi:predicted nucleic acid-binding protein